jgi:ABC-2 type transport system ATP-binding protein
VGPVIELRDVSKAFVLQRNRVGDLKFRLLGGLHRQQPERREPFWALRNLDLQVAAGEFLGLIGPNGSGKSTLLRIIAGIFRPTSGQVVVRGSVVPMIELGAGFHPELSGRENVHLSTSLFGLSTREADGILPSIVEFAGLESFIDVPVKNYSTGMHARLGFAIAVHLNPDVVLVDEVLAVGDEAFQQKCIQRMEELRRAGKTIVLVSHGLESVRKMCDRAALLVHGRLVESGDPEAVIRRYRDVLGMAGPVPAPG